MIKPYFEDKWVRHYCADALNVLRELESGSIDLLATDPPYGIGFMGKDWDQALPDKEIWIECLRVLKPGAFAFVMSIPRSDCLSRMVISLEDAGFNVGFSPMYWTYASGFPKAQNIGKAVDKRGVWNDEFDNVRAYLRSKVKEKGLTHKEIDEALGNVNSHLASHYLGISQPMLPTWEQWLIIKELLGLDEDIDRPPKCIGYERAILGYREVHKGVAFSSEGATELPITEPACPQAKALDGSYGGFQPKPAVEVIIVAMKPLSEMTFVDQALKNRKGITWLDDCRIPTNEIITNHSRSAEAAISKGKYGDSKAQDTHQTEGQKLGRFPANLLISDDVLNDGKITGAGITGSGQIKNNENTSFFGGKGHFDAEFKGDFGSFSRYFDLDKWAQKTFPFLIVPKASKSEKNKGLSGEANPIPYSEYRGNFDTTKSYVSEYPDGEPRPMNKAINNHPTVKPLKLMSYLITLGSRVGDTILDPFMGSGTTTLASKLLNRKCIGIETEEKYCEIAAKRCSQEVLELNL